MTKFAMTPTVRIEFHMALTEEEARALDALAGYGVDEFIRHFYEHLGKSYMEPHEAGLRSLLASARLNLPGPLEAADDARRALQASAKAMNLKTVATA